MSKESRLNAPCEPECWLNALIKCVEADAHRLRPGILENVKLLMSAVECGPVPYPLVRVKKDCFYVRWGDPRTGCFTLSFTGPRNYRWRFINSRGEDSGVSVVRTEHISTIRNLFFDLFGVNGTSRAAMIRDLGKGMKI